MASFTEEVVIKLKDEFTAGAKSIQNATNTMTAGFTAFAGAISAIYAAATLNKFLNEYAAAEKASQQLSFALKAVGVSSKEVALDYQEYARTLQEHSTFSKEEIASVERLLIQYGLFGDTLKRTTQDAVDFATARGIGVEEAGNIFAKAAAGNITMLKRYGVQIEHSALQTKGFNAVLEAVESKFKGFGAAALDTTSGRLDQLSKSFKELGEGIGGMLASIESKYKIFSGITGLTNDFAQALRTNQDEIGKVELRINELTLLKQGQQAELASQGFIKNFLFGKDQTAGIVEITAQLDALDKKLGDLQAKSKAGTTTPTNPYVFKLPDDKELKKAREEYALFLLDLQKGFGSAYDQIDRDREKDYTKLQGFLAKAKLSQEDYQKGLTALEEKASKARMKTTFDELTAGADIFKNFADNIGKDVVATTVKTTQSTLDLIGKVSGNQSYGWAGQIIGIFYAVSQGIKSLLEYAFGTLEEDTRSYLTKITDEIDAVNKALSAAENRFSLEEQHAADLKSGRAGDIQIDTGTNTVGDFLGTAPGRQSEADAIIAKFDQLGLPYGLDQSEFNRNQMEDALKEALQRGEIKWMIDPQGHFGVTWAGKPIGLLIDGKWHIYNNFDWGDDNVMMAICQYVLEYAQRNGLNASQLGVKSTPGVNSSSGTVTTGSISTPSNPSVFTPKTTGAANGYSNPYSPTALRVAPQTAITINVSAMDQQGVSDFLVNSLKPAMLAAGRQGIVLMNQNSVSENI